MRFTVMRPARIISSIARREPNPHAASTLCSRCGSLKTSSVERLCFGGGRLSAIRCSARLGCCIGPDERTRACEWRLGGLCGGIRYLQEVGRIELGERWQLRKGAQAEIIEEGRSRRVERRPSRRFAMADDLDPLPIFERLYDVRRYGDAADGLNVAAGHGLLIGDDRQSFHHRSRISRRFFGSQAVEIRLHIGTALKAPARCDQNELDFAPAPVVTQLFEK